MTFSLTHLSILVLGYLAILFVLAYAVDRNWLPKHWVKHPLVYALSLGVYAILLLEREPDVEKNQQKPDNKRAVPGGVITEPPVHHDGRDQKDTCDDQQAEAVLVHRRPLLVR